MTTKRKIKLKPFNEVGVRELAIETDTAIVGVVHEHKCDDGERVAVASVQINIVSVDGRSWSANADVELYLDE